MTFDYRGTRAWIKRSSASATERLLLLVLTDYAPNIEPSVARIALDMGVDARSVRRLIKSCQAKGLLAVTEREKVGGAHVPNHYEILCPAVSTGPLSVPAECVEGADVMPVLGTDIRSSKADKIKADKKADRKRAHARLVVLPDPDPASEADREALTKHYSDQFEVERGSAPPMDTKDHAAICTLLAKCGLPQAIEAVDGAFAGWRRNSVTIRHIAKDPAEFIGMRVVSDRQRQRQPDSGYSPSSHARRIT